MEAAGRLVPVGEAELHVVEQGEGPAVVLCHGFPELAHSWRHQLRALAAAGYRAIAPDLRGFGASACPGAIEDYDVLALCADLCGLLDALDEEQAVFVGHDWGASLAWQLALLHPERVHAVAGLSIPFTMRAPAPPMEILRRRFGADFYMAWFQQIGEPERLLARDVLRTVTATEAWTRAWALRSAPGHRPAWLDEEDVAVYREAFARTGFVGGLNLYRNIDRNWSLTPQLSGRRIEQPALFLRGSEDWVAHFLSPAGLERGLADLRDSVVVEGAGHWVQQERPDEVSEALLAFLAGLP